MILTLIGARPQFIKAAVVSKQFIAAGIEEIIVHTGQHYDEKMSEVFWNELGIPKPTYNLEVGSGGHAAQTAAIMIKLEDVIQKAEKSITALLVYGDTNSTIAGALVASKLHIPIIHIEAGLRSFNKAMPEEVNRIVTDHLSDLLFCPTAISQKQLEIENIKDNVHICGDVMYDCFIDFKTVAKNTVNVDHLGNDFILLTIHRPSNTDHKETIATIIKELGELQTTIIWPVHPRNKANLNKEVIPENVKLVEPLSYFEMRMALDKCSAVITDSGGLQKEAYWAKKQCITLRKETEWVETLDGEWNQLYHSNKTIKELLTTKPTTAWQPLYGNGTAALQIVDIIKQKYFLNQ